MKGETNRGVSLRDMLSKDNGRDDKANSGDDDPSESASLHSSSVSDGVDNPEPPQEEATRRLGRLTSYLSSARIVLM